MRARGSIAGRRAVLRLLRRARRVSRPRARPARAGTCLLRSGRYAPAPSGRYAPSTGAVVLSSSACSPVTRYTTRPAHETAWSAKRS